MNYNCFWILANGTLVVPDKLHVQAVVSAPELFGETRDSIEASFAKHGESPFSNVEGKARVDVLRRVIQRNHIRIRKNQTRNTQHWSIQVFTLTAERQAVLAAWAHYVTPHVTDKRADVCLHQCSNNSRRAMRLDQLATTHTGTSLVALRQADLLAIPR